MIEGSLCNQLDYHRNQDVPDNRLLFIFAGGNFFAVAYLAVKEEPSGVPFFEESSS